MKKLIYRGYEIEVHTSTGFSDGYVIKKDGHLVSSQTSEEKAYAWIDRIAVLAIIMEGLS